MSLTRKLFLFLGLMSLTACGGLESNNGNSFQSLGNGLFSAEAESLGGNDSETFTIKEDSEASGGKVLEANEDQGEISAEFQGEEGKFDVVVDFTSDEGSGTMIVKVEDEIVGVIETGDEKSASEESGEDSGEESGKEEINSVVIEDVELKSGDEVSLIIEDSKEQTTSVDAISLIKDENGNTFGIEDGKNESSGESENNENSGDELK